jgi:hypothetical protein
MLVVVTVLKMAVAVVRCCPMAVHDATSLQEYGKRSTPLLPAITFGLSLAASGSVSKQ